MTKTRVTFIIPIGPYHEDLAHRAIDSAKYQTVPSAVLWLHDEEGKGPSWARNRLLERVETPYVVFLDADDWVEPTFVERCLEVVKPGQYVYTDWVQGEDVKQAPADPWCASGNWHVITALLPMHAVKQVGGFDDFPGGEDTEFYWALTRSAKCCGIHLSEPLFHYGHEGRRAKQFVNSEQYPVTMRRVLERYGRMGCCSDQIKSVGAAPKEGLPGDVLARAIWAGNRVVFGPASHRQYPRSGNGALMMVDPHDVALRPNLWQRVEPEQPVLSPPMQIPTPQPKAAPDFRANGLEEISQTLFPFAWQGQQPKLSAEQMEAMPPAAVTPDIAGVVSKAREVYGEKN